MAANLTTLAENPGGVKVSILLLMEYGREPVKSTSALTIKILYKYWPNYSVFIQHVNEHL